MTYIALTGYCQALNMTVDKNSLQGIRHFYAYNENLATAGQPDAAQFHLIKEAGFERVINLALADSPHAIANEAGLIQQIGLEYIHIPVDFKSPTLAGLEQFFQIMQQHPAQKTFVHCALNWRVSCFIYLYRTLVCSESEEEARQDLHTIWQPDPIWQKFMEEARLRYSS